MSQLQKIIYLTREQYDKLYNNEDVIAGGITLNGIDEDNLYFITDETISSDELGDDFILPVKNGGTGKTQFTTGSLLVGNGQNALTEIGATDQNTANTIVKRDSNGGFSMGLLKVISSGNTTTIGSQNSGWCHIYNSSNWPFIFNNSIAAVGGASSTATLGTTAYPFHQLILGGTTNATMTAASTNPRITFQEKTGTQPVHLIYTDQDSYRNPAGLKVIGGTDATPVWFEAEGSIFANGGNRVPHTGNTTGTIGSTKKPVYIDGGQIKEIEYTIETSVPSNAVFTDHYAWEDITSKPTTLSGYGITDAASSSHSHTLKIGNKSLSVSTSEQTWNVHDILLNSTSIGTNTSWDQTAPGAYYVASSSAFTGTGHPGTNQEAPYSYGGLYVLRAGNGGAAQIYISHNASGTTGKAYGIRYRSGWNVINNTEQTHWVGWATILDDKNYSLFAWKRPASITTGQVLVSNGNDGTTTTRAILNNTTQGALGYNSAGANNADNLRFMTVNTLAYWNGAYSGTSSNLTYYSGGAFGTMAKETAADYAKLASPALTGTPTAPTAANGTSTTQIATTAFVNNTLSYVNAMRFKGTLGTGGTITALPASHEAGDTYRVVTAGTWAGKYCELGTLIICTTDGTAVNDAHWTSVETNEDGAIIGPENSTGNNIATFNGNTGRIIQDSGKAFSTTAPGSSSTDAQIPTSKAVWSAITGASGYGKTGTVTSITLTQGAGITVSDSGTAISTSGSRTISITGMNTSSGATNKWLNQKGEWTTPPNDNTDTQVNVTATGAAISHNYILMTSTAPTATATGHTALGSTSLWVNSADKGKFELVLGNSTATTTAGGQYGQLALYSAKTAGTYLKAADGTAWSTQTLQAKDGTIALTSDIPSGVSKTAAGLCPQLPNETTTTKFLRQDGTWQVPAYIADTHYTTHLYVNATSGGATSNAATANTTTYMHLYDDSTRRDTIQFKGSGATTVTATGGVITINSTDNNTATATDNILDGSNSGTAITYAPYAAQQSKLSFDTSTTAPTRTDRLNLNGFLYATQYNVAGKVTLQWNATDSSLDFVFA